MRFIYKIYSNYDGFTPGAIPERLINGKFLRLGWRKYLDEVKVRDECWIYFHGKHSFENGIYIKGFIESINREKPSVLLRVSRNSTDSPLTAREITNRISELVSQNYRQVFLWPDGWEALSVCSIENCKYKFCDNCETRRHFKLISAEELYRPPRLRPSNIGFVPAHWIIPSRCYLFFEGKHPVDEIKRQTHMFNEFKIGAKHYSYPLALGIYNALLNRGLGEFDYIVPVPLSPDKIEAKENNRTLLLANDLSEMTGVRVKQLLTLSRPISKRSMQSAGYSPSHFEAAYHRSLETEGKLPQSSKLLVIDDVCTKGSTLTQIARKLTNTFDRPVITFATAGQMILKSVVRNEANIVI